MPIRLDPTERRLVGCLVEKQLTTPDVYPLSLNALLLAANQKSNRDPLSAYAEHEVQGAIRALMDRGWVSELDRAGGRTVRYEHRAAEQLGADPTDLAILAELWLRGPQSAQELATRVSRMRPLASPEAAEVRLRALSTRAIPYVELLPRRSGERVQRWRHLFGDDAARPESSESGSTGGGAARPTSSSAASASTSSSSGSSSGSASGAGDGPSSVPGPSALAELTARVERLERAVAKLRATLEGPGVP